MNLFYKITTLFLTAEICEIEFLKQTDNEFLLYSTIISKFNVKHISTLQYMLTNHMSYDTEDKHDNFIHIQLFTYYKAIPIKGHPSYPTRF